jgi:hypothetical protein
MPCIIAEPCLFMQAYHDVSTHDANAGTGGMDGSIRFELDRAEVGFCLPSSLVGTQLMLVQNAGSGFGNTLPFTELATNRYVSCGCYMPDSSVRAWLNYPGRCRQHRRGCPLCCRRMVRGG